MIVIYGVRVFNYSDNVDINSSELIRSDLYSGHCVTVFYFFPSSFVYLPKSKTHTAFLTHIIVVLSE